MVRKPDQALGALWKRLEPLRLGPFRQGSFHQHPPLRVNN